MAQTPAVYYQEGNRIDYTFSSDATAGDVVVLGSIPLIVPRDVDVSVNALGELACDGIWKVPQDGSGFSAGDAVHWDEDGSPVTGDASSGAATSTTSGNNLMGWAVFDAEVTDTYVYVQLRTVKVTTTVAGSILTTDITGSDSSLAIAGIAGDSGAGGAITVTGGAGDTGAGGAITITGGAGSSEAGGAVAMVGGAGNGANAGGAASVTGGAGGAAGTGGAASLVGGAPASGNAAGGATSVTGGAGSGTGAGGAVAAAGGASGAGATGNGGAISVTGGAALSTNGTGGAASLVGGVATGTGTGGAVTITSGASAGASGTAGAVSIDCGAATGGTAGGITIGGTNAGSITLGKMPIVPSATVAATGSDQSGAAAIVTGITWVTAADGTKGVKLPAAAAGLLCIVKNDDTANAILKVYPNTSDTINALGANNAISMAAKTACIFACYDATAWFTVPLLPS